MGLLTQDQQGYYNGDNFGNYQFISLDDIINQFMAVYVGEDKIIPKAKKMDVALNFLRRGYLGVLSDAIWTNLV